MLSDIYTTSNYTALLNDVWRMKYWSPLDQELASAAAMRAIRAFVEEKKKPCPYPYSNIKTKSQVLYCPICGAKAELPHNMPVVPEWHIPHTNTRPAAMLELPTIPMEPSYHVMIAYAHRYRDAYTGEYFFIWSTKR